MLEIKRIVEAFEAVDFNEHQAALASVVKVEGSSYRSPGAKMLIARNGKWEGSISGGCLEGDALKQARKIMENKTPEILTYDTNEDTNKLLGVNLGCNGIIHVFMEPLTKDAMVMEALKYLQSISTPHLMVTVLANSGHEGNLAPGSRVLIDKDCSVCFDSSDGKLFPTVKKEAEERLAVGHSRIEEIQCEGQRMTVFMEVFEPPIDLLIVGGGFDAKPVASFARQIGWQVRLTDECAAHVFPVNFPGVHVVQCQREYVAEKVTAGVYTAAVLMTHNLDYDREVLIQLLQTDISYIGIVGPKKRWERIKDQLEDRGIKLTEAQLKKIHAPVGLDIGADTPEEIALSILAEIKTHFSGRGGGPLKERDAAIHTKNRETGEVYKPIQLNI